MGWAAGLVVAVCGAQPLWAQDADAARSLLRSGQPEQAAQAYTALIERSPTDPDHWLGRGLARSRLGQWPGAMDDLEKAVALAPGYADAWSALADVYRWNDRPAAAANAYARLAALRPDDAQVRVLQARSLLAAGDVAGARAAAQRAREMGVPADALPAIPDAASPARAVAVPPTPSSVPEASAQGHKWALSGGLYHTRAGSFSANENSFAPRYQRTSLQGWSINYDRRT